MNLQLESFGISIAEKDVLEFEKSLGLSKLPEDYRVFLLKHNGGYTTDYLAFDFYSGNEGSLINGFFGINLDEESIYNYKAILECYIERNRIPNDFLPIAEDAGGNQICLGISGEHTGEIWFWDHEEEADDGEEPSMANMILIAKTFTDFIEGLYEYKLEDDE